MASLCLDVTKKDVDIWIKHFEEQAKRGASERTLLNRHYISVCDRSVSKPLSSGPSGVAQPPIVAPVEQVFAQAAAEVKREKTAFQQEQIERDLSKTTKLSAQCSRVPPGSRVPLKRRRKQIRVPHDIFSK